MPKEKPRHPYRERDFYPERSRIEPGDWLADWGTNLEVGPHELLVLAIRPEDSLVLCVVKNYPDRPHRLNEAELFEMSTLQGYYRRVRPDARTEPCQSTPSP